MVLTDELQQDVYPAATLEDGGNSVESAYYNINVGNIVNTPDEIQGWYVNNNELPPNPDPNIDVNASSTRMYRLNGASGDKVGLGIALKVMTGDNVTIFGKSFWTNAGTSIDNNNYNIVASSLLSLFAGTSAVSSVEGGNASSILNSQITPDELTTLLQNNEPAVTNKPKAFVNWILFDEQFQPVASSSGFDPVDDNPDEAYEHINSVNISQSGYLYVYCSNESNVDVLFDNLQVVHTKGPLLETTHYYPFGLTMAGISDKAIKSNYAENKYRFNGKELQNHEFSDASGIEMYDFGVRNYDQQIGRWWTSDPKSNQMRRFSPYNYAYDNPIRFLDPDGMKPEDWIHYHDQNGNAHTDWVDPNKVHDQKSAEAWAATAGTDKAGNQKNTDVQYIGKEGYQTNGRTDDGESNATYKLNSDGTANRLGSSDDPKPSTTKAELANVEPEQKGGGILDKMNDAAGVIGIEAGAIDLATKEGVGPAEDMAGKVGDITSTALRGVAIIGTAVSLVKTVDDLANGNYQKATVHGLDTAVGIAALYCTAAVVGTVAAPIVAAAALAYGISRVFWGN